MINLITNIICFFHVKKKRKMERNKIYAYSDGRYYYLNKKDRLLLIYSDGVKSRIKIKGRMDRIISSIKEKKQLSEMEFYKNKQ